MDTSMALPTLKPLLEKDSVRFMFLGGKGGVGKSTCSAAVALSLARSGKKTLLISTDPAHNTSDCFKQTIGSEPTKVEGLGKDDGMLYAMEIDPSVVMESEMTDVAGENTDQAFFNDFREWFASVPGIDEAMSLANLLQHSHSDYQKIVIDTAPTGHTLRLLQLPAVLKAGLAKLDSWQTRLGAVLGSVASMLYSTPSGDGQSQADAIARLREKLKSYQVSVEKVAELFRDSNVTNFICVAIAENLSVFETIRLVAQLRKEGISTTHILVNQLVSTSFAQISDSAEPVFEALKALSPNLAGACHEACQLTSSRSKIQSTYIRQLETALSPSSSPSDSPSPSPIDVVRMPLLPQEVRGVEALDSFSHHLTHPCMKLFAVGDGEGAVPPPMEDADAVSVEQLVRILKAAATVDKQQHQQQEEQQKEEQKEEETACQKRSREDPPASSSSPSSSPSAKKLKAEDYFPKMQALLMQPGGIQRVLAHSSVVELRDPANKESTASMRMLFDNLEGGNLMGALMGLGDPVVKGKLMEIAPKVVEDLGL